MKRGTLHDPRRSPSNLGRIFQLRSLLRWGRDIINIAIAIAGVCIPAHSFGPLFASKWRYTARQSQNTTDETKEVEKQQQQQQHSQVQFGMHSIEERLRAHYENVLLNMGFKLAMK